VARQIFVVRHGETEWSRAGRHTGLTDLPLTERGRELAVELAPVLARHSFSLVLCSPLTRAWETCELAGLGDVAVECADLVEWDYGDYEGLTTPEIWASNPGWDLWRDGCPGGESPAEVGARAERALAPLRSAEGEAAIAFAHGHLLRTVAARWIELPPSGGARFTLEPAAVSVLGYERHRSVIAGWNMPPP
jgi:broad specificity phosphatase PhoE